jgi:PAS domain S-box-containing protein
MKERESRVPLKLLLVEDSEDDAELIVLELERAGYELQWRRLETEEDFVAALDEWWDLIISDFQMPQFDGLRAFALYKDKGIDTPFIFVSGALGEDRAVEAMRAGARDYLLKGNLARLTVAVRRELAEARNRRAQRSAEQATRQEQRRLAMAVEASGAGVFEHAVPLGDDIYFSERWADILGYTLADMPEPEGVVAWIEEQIHPDDLPVVRSTYAQFIAGRLERYAGEFRMRHNEGAWIDVAGFAKAVKRGADSRAMHVVGVMLDLSERRRLEAQLQQAQKMEAVGRLAGGVAHDFNNLLTVIFSFGNFVLDELRDGEPVHDDMQEVLKAAKRAERLTSQLLAFSRRKPVSPKVLSINTLVGEMDRMLRRLVGEDVDVSTRLSDHLWNVRIDPGSLEQVVVNLAVNARDAMLEGGKLTIETDNADIDEEYSAAHGSKVPEGQYVVLAISDDGVGMDAATQARIFEPFFTTKGSGKGTGLGLSTCYGIVKQAGGYIWVYSEPGRGTTFRIYLPRVVEETERVPILRPPESLSGTETILVAEDDEQVRRLAARALTRFGYRVVEAANGGEALQVCEQFPERIDLLLTDVVMPEMSGKQLVERLQPLRPEMKVLYMSGYTANAIVHRGVLEPDTHLLQKPFAPEMLARKVRELLDR